MLRTFAIPEIKIPNSEEFQQDEAAPSLVQEHQSVPILGIGRGGPIAWLVRCRRRHSLEDLLFKVVFVL